MEEQASIEQEMAALKKIVAAMKDLPTEAHPRVLGYINSRFGERSEPDCARPPSGGG